MIINDKIDEALDKIELNQSKTELVELTWNELLTLKRLIKQDDYNTDLLRDSVKESCRIRKILKDY